MSTLASKGPLESKMPALAFYQLKAAILVLSLMITFGTDFWSRILNTLGDKRYFSPFLKMFVVTQRFFLIYRICADRKQARHFDSACMNHLRKPLPAKFLTLTLNCTFLSIYGIFGPVGEFVDNSDI